MPLYYYLLFIIIIINIIIINIIIINNNIIINNIIIEPQLPTWSFLGLLLIREPAGRPFLLSSGSTAPSVWSPGPRSRTETG